jgi:hypothetical protein
VPPFSVGPDTSGLDLGKLLDHIESDNVQSIDVASLAALMTDKHSHGLVYDVDPVSDREKLGVIPGALVLSSWDKFDVATDGRLQALGEIQDHLVERYDRAAPQYEED